jgi:HrpA-like RNA helicase
LNDDRFRNYFGGAPQVNIKDRAYPVEILHLEEAACDVHWAVCITVCIIRKTEKKGDILVFMSGEQEIERVCAVLR